MTEYTEKSRSQKKRESTALQAMGEELAALPLEALRKLDLPKDLFEAFADLDRMTKHEARRRQMQFVGKLMREVENPEILHERITAVKAFQNKDNAFFERIEVLRAGLLAHNPADRKAALDTLSGQFPAVERTKISRLQEAALNAGQEDAEAQKRQTKASRELFRYLREVVGQAEEKGE